MTVKTSQYGSPAVVNGGADGATKASHSHDAASRSDERYRSLVLATASIVWVTNPQGEIVEECPTWGAFTGQTFEGYRGLGWLDAVHSDDRAHVRQVWSDALRQCRLYDIEYRLRHRDGGWHHMLVRGVPVRDTDGNVREWVGMCSDISDRVRVEEALREEVRINDILHNVGMSLAAELNLQKLIQQVTDAATAVVRARHGAFFYTANDEKGGLFTLFCLSGAQQEAFEKFPTPRATEIFGPAFRGEGVSRIEDVTTDPRFGKNRPFNGLPEGHPPVKSFLSVPVITRAKEVIGGLFFGHPDPGVFTARDERIVRGIASQAAIAIENASLVRDIRQTQQELHRQLAFNSSITESVGEGLYAVDTEGRTTFVNPAAEKMLGWTRDELLGKDMHEVIHYRHANRSGFDKRDCPLISVLVTGRTVRVDDDVFIRRDGTTIPVAYTSSPTSEDGQVVGAVVAFHDITQRKWAEEALRRSKEQLEELIEERTLELQVANQQLLVSNRELEDFASVASHDLQEPLRKIQAFGDRLEAKAAGNLGSEGQDYLHRMRNAAGRMQTLISDLLQFSRVTTRAQPFTPTDLNQIARDVLVDLETRIEQTGGKVELGELPSIDADPVQMRQLVQNLIGNALKFRKPSEPPVVKVRSEVDAEAGVARLYFEDNGIGFDEKYLDRIFNVFQRLHSRGTYEGTGIGLAVCRKIAARHGGSVNARSKPDVGSTFIVSLPLRHPETREINA